MPSPLYAIRWPVRSQSAHVWSLGVARILAYVADLLYLIRIANSIAKLGTQATRIPALN